MLDVIELTRELIRRESVTPNDAGCQRLIAEQLGPSGFDCVALNFGDVENLWCTHGQGGPVLVFLGHTDVVPTGPVERWTTPPFEPVVREGQLYGRGSADMKGSVAAMAIALKDFVANHADHNGTVALLLTSDEEGIGKDGVRRIAQVFRERGQRIDWCVVGEPSSKQQLGDLIRVGRRGSLTGRLKILGVQGHVAYPQLANNPIHVFAPALAELAATVWDDGNAEFPPTSFQVSNFNAGTGADNVIPGDAQVNFNFRYGTASTEQGLRERVEAVLQKHDMKFELDWWLSGEPFLSPADGRLRAAVIASIREQCNIEPECSTGGGTSDGRFIAPLGAEVVELGPDNATIHQVDECVPVEQLQRLPDIYRRVAERLLVTYG
ncbi:MAG: succinyl-diaminopimelate desuccinylase [Dokdonella sp.]